MADDVKYILIEHADGAQPARITICDTDAQRIDATRQSMFMDGDISEHEEEFANAISALTEDGHLAFEGDPPVGWLTATVPALSTLRRELEEAISDRAEALTMLEQGGVRIADLEAKLASHDEKTNLFGESLFSLIDAGDEAQRDLTARAIAAEKERDEAVRKFHAEELIVCRIWVLLGKPSYEELNGRSIYDLIRAEIDARRAAEARAARLEDDRAQASNRLSLIVFHLREFEKSGNIVTLGYAIKCGEALIKSLDAALSPPQSLHDETPADGPNASLPRHRLRSASPGTRGESPAGSETECAGPVAADQHAAANYPATGDGCGQAAAAPFEAAAIPAQSCWDGDERRLTPAEMSIDGEFYGSGEVMLMCRRGRGPAEHVAPLRPVAKEAETVGETLTQMLDRREVAGEIPKMRISWGPKGAAWSDDMKAAYRMGMTDGLSASPSATPAADRTWDGVERRVRNRGHWTVWFHPDRTLPLTVLLPDRRKPPAQPEPTGEAEPLFIRHWTISYEDGRPTNGAVERVYHDERHGLSDRRVREGKQWNRVTGGQPHVKSRQPDSPSDRRERKPTTGEKIDG